MNSTTSKTKLFGETSSIVQDGNIKDEAILRDFLQKWKVECRADGLLTMCFAIVPLHLSKVTPWLQNSLRQRQARQSASNERPRRRPALTTASRATTRRPAAAGPVLLLSTTRGCTLRHARPEQFLGRSFVNTSGHEDSGRKLLSRLKPGMQVAKHIAPLRTHASSLSDTIQEKTIIRWPVRSADPSVLPPFFRRNAACTGYNDLQDNTDRAY